MNWRKGLLKKSKLYLILDKDTCQSLDIFELASKIKDKGIDVVQLREKRFHKKTILKDAGRLRPLLAKKKTLFIINDHADIAVLVNADGVHLGQDDLAIDAARKILGKNRIIGVSCHNLRQALLAQKKGADYIGLGPVFPTPTKPKYGSIGLEALRQIKRKIRIPVFAIGGINQNNLTKVLAVGIGAVAVCRGICLSKNPAKSTADLRKMMP